MIAEALEAAWVVASALAAWIVAGVVAVTVGLYAVVVAGWGIWRVVRAVYRFAGARTALYVRLSPEVPEGAPFPAPLPQRAADARLRPRPSWARTDKEAA